eukprot:scaffold1356_cov123-Cylindrotheca_fusiformis.AAC.41
MRVLLPLRKVASNKEESDSGLSDLEDEESYQETDSVEVSPGNFEQSYHHTASEFSGEHQTPHHTFATVSHANHDQAFDYKVASALQDKTSPGAGPRLASLKQAASIEPDRNCSPSGKRKAASGGTDLKPCKKRPALDKKPPARDLGTMGAPGRTRFHRSNGSQRRVGELVVTADPLQHSPSSGSGLSSCSAGDLDSTFVVALQKNGLEIREQAGDGNCLFRAVSLQVYGDPSMHTDVRKQCMDFMDRDKEHFSQFVTGEPFDQYIERKRNDGVHGNNPEIQAISELFNRPVEVFCPENGATPLNIFHAEYKTDDAPIRLSYHDGNHYNAVVDPLVPTAGLGLGLPDLKPGLADKLQMSKAVAESDAIADQMQFQKALKDSEQDELQRAIKESKLSAEHGSSNRAMALSDMDATYFELEQAALENSLESYNTFEHGKKQKASNSGARRRNDRDAAISDASVAAAGPSANPSAPSSSAVASLPTQSMHSQAARIPPPVAAAASVASAAASLPSAAKKDDDSPLTGTSIEEYPQTVQELVLNGFELQKVVRAYELVGDNFDGLLACLISNKR